MNVKDLTKDLFFVEIPKKEKPLKLPHHFFKKKQEPIQKRIDHKGQTAYVYRDFINPNVIKVTYDKEVIEKND